MKNTIDTFKILDFNYEKCMELSGRGFDSGNQDVLRVVAYSFFDILDIIRYKSSDKKFNITVEDEKKMNAMDREITEVIKTMNCNLRKNKIN